MAPKGQFKLETPMGHSSTVTIPKEAYERLTRQANLLEALEAGGVDNWEGYHEATKEFYADDNNN